MSDYCDDDAFKEHPLFSQDPTALQIMIFYDDVEVVNPLGSYTKKNTNLVSSMHNVRSIQ